MAFHTPRSFAPLCGIAFLAACGPAPETDAEMDPDSAMVSPAPEMALGCPASAEPVLADGWEAYRGGDMGVARGAFDEALERCDGNLDARTGLGFVTLQEGAAPAAEQMFQAVVADDETFAEAHLGLGTVAWRRGDTEAAKAHLQRVLELDPGHAEATTLLQAVREAEAEGRSRPIGQ